MTKPRHFAASGLPLRWLAWPLVLVLSACAAPQRYQAPSNAASAGQPGADAFKEDALWKRANPGAADAVPDAWWRLFDDPVLNGLQDQVALGNENLRASTAQVRVAVAALSQAQAGRSPVLGATFGATRADAGAGRPATSYSLGASASWEVDLWGRLSGTVDQAGARLQASRHDLAAAELSIRALLVQTYFSLRAAEAQIATLDSAVAAYERSLELTRNRYAVGVASAADVAQAQTQLKSSQAQGIEARTSRATLEHALATLLGKAPSQLSLASTARLPAVPEVPRLLPSRLVERRPDIAAAERRVAAAHAQLGVAQTAFFPSLTLSAGAGYRGNSLAGLIGQPNLFWSFGPSIVLAAFDGGAREAAKDSAQATMEQVAAQYRQTVLAALQEVEDNLVEAANLAEQGALQAQALEAAQKTLDIVTNQYRAGTVSYLNVVSAQASALASQRALVDLQARRLQAVNQLLKNIAGRWKVPADLAAQ